MKRIFAAIILYLAGPALAWAGPRDYFEVLGVEWSASDAEIKKAYRQLVKKHHPDVAGDSREAGEKLRAINDAYETLRDPQKRADYKLGIQIGRMGAGDNPRVDNLESFLKQKFPSAFPDDFHLVEGDFDVVLDRMGEDELVEFLFLHRRSPPLNNMSGEAAAELGERQQMKALPYAHKLIGQESPRAKRFRRALEGRLLREFAQGDFGHTRQAVGLMWLFAKPSVELLTASLESGIRHTFDRGAENGFEIALSAIRYLEGTDTRPYPWPPEFHRILMKRYLELQETGKLGYQPQRHTVEIDDEFRRLFRYLPEKDILPLQRDYAQFAEHLRDVELKERIAVKLLKVGTDPQVLTKAQDILVQMLRDHVKGRSLVPRRTEAGGDAAVVLAERMMSAEVRSYIVGILKKPFSRGQRNIAYAFLKADPHDRDAIRYLLREARQDPTAASGLVRLSNYHPESAALQARAVAAIRKLLEAKNRSQLESTRHKILTENSVPLPVLEELEKMMMIVPIDPESYKAEEKREYEKEIFQKVRDEGRIIESAPCFAQALGRLMGKP
jgi:curved DNA-binding protein CbpA